MNKGRLIAVVGASGVGKDSVISGVLQAAPVIRRVRRTITRSTDVYGEDHAVATPEAFSLLLAQGEFCLHWSAHGHRYGIPSAVLKQVNEGEQCLANLSRNALTSAANLFPSMTVLNITVESATLAERLALRGRENAEQIKSRLGRVVSPIPTELDVYEIGNDGPLETTVSIALDALGLAAVTRSRCTT